MQLCRHTAQCMYLSSSIASARLSSEAKAFTRVECLSATAQTLGLNTMHPLIFRRLLLVYNQTPKWPICALCILFPYRRSSGCQ